MRYLLQVFAILLLFNNIVFTQDSLNTNADTGDLIIVIIGLLAVSFQAIKAARRNPVETLRYE